MNDVLHYIASYVTIYINIQNGRKSRPQTVTDNFKQSSSNQNLNDLVSIRLTLNGENQGLLNRSCEVRAHDFKYAIAIGM